MDSKERRVPGRITQDVSRSRASRGFTLIELLVVMVIIGLLGALVGPRLFRNVGKSKVTAAKAQISMLMASLGQYKLEVGTFPTTEEGLLALRVKPVSAARWDGPYIQKEIPMDPWGNPYVYRSPGQKNPTKYDLYSAGPDRIPDTEDDDWGQ